VLILAEELQTPQSDAFCYGVKVWEKSSTLQAGRMTLSQVLRNHAFTRGLGDTQIATLAVLASEVTFEENEFILVDGQRSQSFFLVISGSVSVELRTPSYVVSVQAVGPGEAFGWSSLLEDHDTLFLVRAREHTTALRLDGRALKAACHEDTLLGTEILQRALALVTGRVRATEIRFAEMCGVRV
jgi:CRP-like cAMP-binding protein